MHIVQVDTDSLTLAISGDKNRGPEQRFDAVIKDAEFYNKNKGFFFSEDNQRKVLGVHIEKKGLNCIALSPKNYIINDECGDVSFVAKGLHIDWHAIFISIWEAAIKYTSQSSSGQSDQNDQRWEFRASANDLQLFLIRRLQKTILTNVQDLLQISDIIDRYNQ
ncbi:MAG: hypothetical protein EZS28_016574 [Streblomastix strix]|uniref:Uncharacterized protein n=1 Tax=Streblomastix strix TaxID=222440 RepID=A0A5J4VYY8_9EUKA|nr:MAG: hypothetical protein EZS28_016574 [Streblomastix strix]